MIILPSMRGALGGANTFDPFFANVIFLSHMDTTGYLDQKGHTETTHGSPTSVASTPGFGNAIDCGTSGSNYVTYAPSGSDFDLAGDFCIEFQLKARRTNVAEGYVDMSGGTAGLNAPLIYSNGVNGVYIFYNGADRGHVAIATIGSFVSYCFARSGNTINMFRNGAISASPITFSGTFTCPAITVGNSNSAAFQSTAILDEIRITKGVARYTTTYSPQTMPFPNQ